VATKTDAFREYGLELSNWNDLPQANAVVAAVSHDALVTRDIDEVLTKLVSGGVYMDVKSTADPKAMRDRGVKLWRL
jgi:UDP-N-acetyl-D-galactosamine dehydrogenase